MAKLKYKRKMNFLSFESPHFHSLDLQSLHSIHFQISLSRFEEIQKLHCEGLFLSIAVAPSLCAACCICCCHSFVLDAATAIVLLSSFSVVNVTVTTFSLKFKFKFVSVIPIDRVLACSLYIGVECCQCRCCWWYSCNRLARKIASVCTQLICTDGNRSPLQFDFSSSSTTQIINI